MEDMMTPRAAKTPAKKTAARTTKTTPPVVDEIPDTDEVAVVADLAPTDVVDDDQSQPGTDLATVEHPTGMVTKDGTALRTDHVIFRGRTMIVKVPDEVQLAVIKRFSDQYGAMDARGEQQIEAKKAIAMSGRAIAIIQSVLDDEDDRDWIEDSLLRKEFALVEALDIVQDALQRLKIVNAPNREERRAAEKKSRLVTS